MQKFFLSLAAALTLTAVPSRAQMLTEANDSAVFQKTLEADFVVVGGGLSGICAAVSAARHGASVILIQDRPVLGGNCSSETRMGICGAKSAEAYEAGILEEMQIKNFYYNPQQRYTLWDDVMYGTVVDEDNITLLLNTSVNGVVMDGGRIAAVKAWNSNSYTFYTVKGKLFADCSGDSILRLSGAKYRRGRELPSDFNEYFTKEGGDSHTMGNSILLQLHRTDKDVPFIAPEWAYHFTDEDFKDIQMAYKTDTLVYGRICKVKYNYKIINTPENNNFWWVEFGGEIDSIKDANAIQYELKRIAYGIWEYMKNHPDGRCNGYELDWIGSLPGKRESSRYVGPHTLTQDDVMTGGHFDNNVAYGGWTLDVHDFHGFHNQKLASTEYASPIPFGIPFSTMYSVNIPNLLFAGRNISATHIAFSATRVMATCALMGQAVGTAAGIAIEKGITPAEVDSQYISLLQARLEDDDCMIPFRWRKVSDLTLSAKTDAANEIVRNGIDRNWEGQDNGVWLAPGADITYTWKKPVVINGARIVFDSDFVYRGKRMRKLEGDYTRVEMPKMLAKSFKVEVCDKKGKWTTVYEQKNNIKRLNKIGIEPVEAKGMRLVVDSAWGGEKVHVFGFDAL